MVRQGKREEGESRRKGESNLVGAAEERLTRQRKTEPGEILDLKVKDCLGGVNRVDESLIRRGRREKEGREGRREGRHHGKVLPWTVSVQVIRG